MARVSDGVKTAETCRFECRSLVWGDRTQEKQLKWLPPLFPFSVLAWSSRELFFLASKKPRSYQSDWLRKPSKRRGGPTTGQHRRNEAPLQAQAVGSCDPATS